MKLLIKRTVDLLLSAGGLLLLSPVLALFAIAICLDSAGPALYLGKRVGKEGRSFHIMKFRTMITGADKMGSSSTSEDDQRITRVGSIMRRLKVDELPQLFNVLFGTMSFVGPRPQVQWAVDLYTKEEQCLLSVRPGITDFASLYFRNEGEILRGSADPDADYLRLIAPGKIRLGVSYVHNHNLFIDTKIVIATVLSIFGIDPLWCFGPQQKAALLHKNAPYNQSKAA